MNFGLISSELVFYRSVIKIIAPDVSDSVRRVKELNVNPHAVVA